ncbi:Spermidine/putrescine import ATP-binding protein PotA [Planktothrix tepida]|uniref:Spermidine/putrescine import ATP-binding protein PotA n=1 Tax=Planktothrix tepida PCC 9214 TaxID=671072 RepID=A0A1J1LGA7_9CYAN|nr:ABC transporter ATP-binding protein [Planktothrix tepida]CAD5925358.1 Spermidine/putrescine import ATP-binding protein PotA [Planktothrix tepida]CUR31222.1 putative sperimidine/putrescine transport protein (ABC superfamily, atp_bind) [Planktothrix tepida PCC 9214]
MNLAVELLNVSKLFKGLNSKEFLAVNQVNLEIKTGEFFSLLGPSGCGKTTTLRMIAGFELPTSGEILIHQEPMKNRPPFHRPVNTVFQNYALFPHLTIAENVAFGLEMENLPRPQIKSRVADALSLVKLTDFQTRYPRQLSGGQQQRVALARALVKQPKVLLFDEPLGALDLKLRKEMQLELKKMQKQLGITFVYVTHDQEEALTLSDRIGVMNHGELLQVGTPLEIYEYPKTKFVADFIGETNVLTGRVTQIKGQEITILVDEQLTLHLTTSQPVIEGQIINLVIRPEKITLYPNHSQNQTNDPNIETWKGILEESIYLGTDTRYNVRLTDKMVIMIRIQNCHQDDLQRFTIGQQVNVAIPPNSIRIIEY